MLKRFKNFALLVLILVSYSCAKDEAELGLSPSVVTKAEKDDLMKGFAKALSSVVEENKEVRQFLKDEALKQFDKNYDVLWENVKFQNVGGLTLRERVENASSVDLVQSVEQAVPELNIFFSDIPFFDVKPETYDAEDSELPVVVPIHGTDLMYYAGEFVDTIAKGVVPDFNVLVVNENSRVVVNDEPVTRSTARTWRFRDDAYDGTKSTAVTRSAVVGSAYIGNRAIEAFQYFYKDDASVNSKHLQRDYIYYGMTPKNDQSESFNYNVNEYLFFIEVNPKSFYVISDDKSDFGGDPIIKKSYVYKEKRDFTENELVSEIWTKGVYNFRVELLTSRSSSLNVYCIPAKPSDIWNLNINHWRRHASFWRHSKYYYEIDPNDFTTKRYYCNIPLRNWNLAEESLYRDIWIYEEDPSTTVVETYEYEDTRVKSSKFKGDVKVELGFGKSDKNKATGEVSFEVSNTNTTREKKSVVTNRTMGSDLLTHTTLYFYEPILEKCVSDNTYEVRTYGGDAIKFGITAY